MGTIYLGSEKNPPTFFERSLFVVLFIGPIVLLGNCLFGDILLWPDHDLYDCKYISTKYSFHSSELYYHKIQRKPKSNLWFKFPVQQFN